MRIVHRQILNLPGRAVHYRVGGAGPAVVVLHQSPQSSAFVVPQMRTLIEAGYCVVAPDTPGFGQSDPLPGTPSISDLGVALLEFLDALGLQQVAVCGLHTGALIAVEAASRAPDRIALAIADGYPIFSDEECVGYLRDYLQANPTTWDGSHLSFMWARLREQAIFFPWHGKRAEQRLPMALPTPAVIHQQLIAALQVGEDFADRYGAVWRDQERISRLSQLSTPTALLYRQDDPLAAHQSRLPALPEVVVVQRLQGKPELAHAFLQTLDANRSRLDWADAGNLGDSAERYRAPRHIVRTQGGGIGVRMGSLSSQPLIVLNEPGCAHREDPAQGIALDLPGHGDSDSVDPGWCEPNRMAQLLSQAITRLGIERYRMQAIGSSASYAVALARIDSTRMAALELLNPPKIPPELRAAYASADAFIPPDLHGGYLLALWQRLRDRALWEPHFMRTPEHAISREAALAPSELARGLFDALMLGELATPMMHALYQCDLERELKMLDVPWHIRDEPIQP